MNILAVESSCDETAVAIVRNGREVLCDCIASQVDLHRIYGGVVPEIASRKHIEAIYGLADQALQQSNLSRDDIDAVAVTYAPGLIGAVLVGVNFAKAAAMAMNKPLIPVHHIRGHIAANYLAYPDLEPPFLCLVVSGGHTMIIEVKDYTDMNILGTTLDDAAGECFDKVARVLVMPYPGGAALDKAAKLGDEAKYILPRSKPGENPYNMSFSGLKTAALNLIHHAEQIGEKL
ncbi:MAG: tRNA (adenosine(37)-N6)-threonylcarbamoyltransferase complex transferase subunit TsaD, partial [Oscillospiraceae bacterium]|nr:tRNA (adenosine(37)-N6)-threonylcarbamoyltransferase complex transferase subunit TsaD [Oscillospiraceae bacterium]